MLIVVDAVVVVVDTMVGETVVVVDAYVRWLLWD